MIRIISDVHGAVEALHRAAPGETALLVLGPEAGPSLATKLGIAGYFLVRSQTGIHEITTPVFDQLSAK